MEKQKKNEETVEMTPTNKYVLNAFIRTTSPLHIASPEKKRYDLAEGRKTSGKNGTTLTGIQCMKLPEIQTVEYEKADGSKGSYTVYPETPVIPGNNINGHLRRLATEITLDVINSKKAGEKINIETYLGMTCGAVTGNPEGATILFDEYRKYRNNVFVGIFGGGPRMLRRNARVHNAVPLVADRTLDLVCPKGSPARHPEIDSIHGLNVLAPDIYNNITQVWLFNRKDDIEQLTNVELQEKSIEGYIEKIQERQQAVLEEKAKSKGSDEKELKTTTRTFSSLEFVLPGVNFPLTCELDLNDAQMALYLLTLERFTQKDRIGGWQRNGFGLFNLEHVCLTGEDGKVVNDIFVGQQLNRDNELVARFLEAWEEQKAQLEAKDLDYLYRLPKPKEDKKKKA
jgi:CRISPR type IV-associated protein Csf2